MNDKAKEPVWIMLSVIILFWFSSVVYGQVQPPPSEQTAGSPSAVESKTNIRRVGVVLACYQPEIRFDKPMTRGKAVLHGAGFGAVPVYASAKAVENGALFPALAAICLAPVGAVVGTVAGVIKGSSEKEIKEAEDTLRGYLGTLDFQETLRERLLSVARDQTQYSFVPLEPQGPQTPDEVVPYDLSSYKDINAVLEVGVRSLELTATSGVFNPNLQIWVRVDTRFFSAKDGKGRDMTFFHYSSAEQKFTDWSADNAKPFKEELGRGFQSLSEEIIKKVISYSDSSAESSEGMKTEER